MATNTAERQAGQVGIEGTAGVLVTREAGVAEAGAGESRAEASGAGVAGAGQHAWNASRFGCQ